MDNRTLLIPVVSFLLAGIISCAKKSENHHAEENSSVDEWADMDKFHMIMAESFHPFMDSGNLEPAKENAAAMEELAARWSGSPLPDKVNNNEMKQKLIALKTSTSNFNTLVTNKEENVLGDSLTKIHDLFHSIQESWYGGGEQHEH